MSEMIERVLSEMKAHDAWRVPDANLRVLVRVAIAAMRRPTREMIEQFVTVQYGVYGDAEAEAIWTKMIDAALKE